MAWNRILRSSPSDEQDFQIRSSTDLLDVKDGRRYIHCKLCNRCVKPTWTHCGTCNRCCLPHHQCGLKPPVPIACYCGSLNHVRKDCPIFPVSNLESVTMKRKISDSQATQKGRNPKKQKIKQN